MVRLSSAAGESDRDGVRVVGEIFGRALEDLGELLRRNFYSAVDTVEEVLASYGRDHPHA